MRNILNIVRHDSKKITGSVVAIITVLGLCLIPCLYAWFNIFSNWAPYDSDATGRISVAVANADRGYAAAGLKVNVGEKIVSALEANDAIGWRFVDSKEAAVDGVYAGDYYAALVVPEDFTADVLSFMNGSLKNPTLVYFENEKKNAIAPKITGKAKTAVQEEVNAAFVETLAGYVSDAASVADASGSSPSSLLEDLSDKAKSLARDVDSCIMLSESAAGITQAAGTLLDVSGALTGSAQDVLTANDKLLEETEKQLAKTPGPDTKALEEIEKSLKNAEKVLKALKDSAITLIDSDQAAFVIFLDVERDDWIQKTDRLRTYADEQSAAVAAEGFTALASEFTRLSDALGDISMDLASLSKEMTEDERKAVLKQLSDDTDRAAALTDQIEKQIKTDLETNLATALADAGNSVASFRESLSTANGGLSDLSVLMGEYGSSLGKLQSGIDKTTASLRNLQSGSDSVARILSNTAGNELLQRLSGMLGNDETAVAEYLANPIAMDKETIWSIENYGSAMAPFYTVLAQWVGALLTAVLIKVKIKKRDDLTNLRLHEWYFGRYGLYLMVGLAQGLVVSLGDLYYVGIQCTAPLRFILAACVNGIVFMMINYALVFALDNIGLGAAVIILVLQVAGSGGTYPIEVLPGIFKILYPFMPFRYSMNAMRECIGGMYDGTYTRCLGVLGLFFIFAVAFGLALYRPARRLNEMIAESKAKSEIML